MKARWFAVAFLLFLAVDGLSLEPSRAYAWCCPCTCMPTCTCVGRWDAQSAKYCPHCLSPDPILQALAPVNRPPDESTPTNGSQLPSLAISDMIGQVVNLRVGQRCLLDKVALGLFGDKQASLRFQTLEFQVATNK